RARGRQVCRPLVIGTVRATNRTGTSRTGWANPPMRRRQLMENKAMRITDVRVHVLEAKLSQPFSYSRAWYATRTALVVEIATDQGLTGWGECYRPVRINAAVVEAMRPLLIGQDPM